MGLGTIEHTNQKGIDMTIPASAHVDVSAGADFSGGNVPRCLFVVAAGTVIITDWNDVEITYTLEVGLLPFRPKSLAAGTSTVVAWY